MKTYKIALLHSDNYDSQIILKSFSELSSDILLSTTNINEVIQQINEGTINLLIFPVESLAEISKTTEQQLIYISNTIPLFFFSERNDEEKDICLDKCFEKYFPVGYLSSQYSAEDTLRNLEIGSMLFKHKKNCQNNENELAKAKQDLLHLNKNFEQSLKKNTELSLQAEVSLKSQERFLNNISHEIRTPLNGINGVIYLLKQTSLDEIQKEYLKLLETSASNLQTVVYDLLDYSRIESGNLQVNLEPFNLKYTIVRLLKTFTYRAHKKGIEIVFEPKSKIPEELIGDESKITQIMLNLVSNALKFSSKGEIHIDICVDDKSIKAIEQNQIFVHFKIDDEGIGIEESKLNKLFQAFDPGEQSKTKQFAGTGLGLALSKQLVEMMNGKIWCESKIGVGSVFHFVIPFEKGKEIKQDENCYASLKNKRVLIVDDSAGTRSLLKKILHYHELKTNTAATFNETKNCLHEAKATSIPYDFILLDLTLPDTSGWVLADLIMKDCFHQQSKIIIITGLTGSAEEEYAQTIGVAGFLKKPFTSEDILNSIKNILDNKSNHEKEKKNKELTEIIPLNILLVEDEKINQIFAKKVLEKHGHTIETALNGREAVDKYLLHNLNTSNGHKPFDLVLMDVQMPEMNGLDATKKIREYEGSLCHIPVIALTAYAMPEDKKQCLDAGMDDFFTKPININSLLLKINEYAKLMINVEKNKQVAFDSSKLLDFQNNDTVFLVELINAFIELHQNYTEQIKHDFIGKDINALQKNIHTLKGVLRTFMANKSLSICMDVEDKCKDNTIFNFPELIDELTDEVFVLKNELHTFAREIEE